MSIDYFLGSTLGVDLKSVTAGEGTSAFGLSSVTSVDPGTIRVVFNEAVLSDTSQQTVLTLPIYDPYNFIITEQLSFVPIHRGQDVVRVLRVKKVNDTTFDLITNYQTNTWYDLEVINIYDAYGNPIDASSNSLSFYGSRHQYEILANEMRVLPMGYTGGDGYEVEDFLPDQSLPILQNQNPGPYATGVAQNIPIRLEVVDYGEGVNPNATTLKVEGVTALLGGVQQPGFTVHQTVIPSGYLYTIRPDVQLFEGTIVTIGVYAEDNAHLPMAIDTSYSFTTTGSGPVLENQSPAPYDEHASPLADIIFDLVDPHSDINAASVIIRVNGITAWANQTSHNSHTAIVAGITGGYRYRINVPGAMPDGAASVAVIADNEAEVPISINETYTFTVDSSVIPQLLAPLAHRFNIDQINMVVAQQPKTVWNQFDEHGLTVSLNRLEGEKNWEYKRRLMDTLVHAANSSYQGMVHGITRELGLALSQPVIINPRVDDNGEFLAPDPYIRFEGAYLYLYSDYRNNKLDWAIDRYEAGGNYEHLIRMVNFINTTHFFEAGILPDFDHYTRSMTLINQSNRILVPGESIVPSTRFRLENGRIVRHSVTFNDKFTFKREMANVDAVTTKGQYHIDYHKGIVTVASVPEYDIAVRYQYTEYPFKPVASPVIVYDITNHNFRAKMFKQVQLDDGTYTHGMPQEVGVDIINELLSVVPMYWGL